MVFIILGVIPDFSMAYEILDLAPGHCSTILSQSLRSTCFFINMSDGSCLRTLTFAVLLAWNAFFFGVSLGNALLFFFFFFWFLLTSPFQKGIPCLPEIATTLSYLSLSFLLSRALIFFGTWVTS